MLCAEFDG